MTGIEVLAGHIGALRGGPFWIEIGAAMKAGMPDWGTLESGVLSYLVNSVWQVPLLFAVGLMAARILRKISAEAEHRVWVAVLLLESVVPAFSMLDWGRMRALLSSLMAGRESSDVRVSVMMGTSSGARGLHLPAWLLAVVAVAYADTCFYFAARFLWNWRRLSAVRRRSHALTLVDDAALDWELCAQRFGIADASIAVSPEVFGPVTMGLRRGVVVLPESMAADLSNADLRTVFAHEFAHMRRNDFLKNLIYELLSLPARYHPVLRLTRERVTQSREVVCDQMAAHISGRSEYARSLLRLASLLVNGRAVGTAHAIGIFDANGFERRLMSLTGKQNEVRGVRRLVMVAACVMLGIGTCVSAIAFEMPVNAASTEGDKPAAKPTEPLPVSPGEIAGNRISGEIPVYPPEAKKARIQGTVVLNAIISKDGSVENLTVVSGPEELQQSALDAVRTWTYKPFLLNGDPVEVKTTVSVIYTLAR